MSGSVFVVDANGTPLMPMAAAYARKLLRSGRARLQPHYAFTVVRLSQVIEQPSLRPVVLAVAIRRHTAELFVFAEGDNEVFPLLSLIVDLYTDVPRRLRRRAAHRRRRRARGRYRPNRRYGQAFKLRRPSVAQSRRLPRARKPAQQSAPGHISPTMRWRAQALERVIAALRKLAPISHVVILDPANDSEPEYRPVTPAERRQWLIEHTGAVNEQGRRVAVCAYCGTSTGTIEVDHILPESRGGTDAWHNLVLACTACNDRKGDRTPEEAGMPLRSAPVAPPRSHRTAAYRRWTARLLTRQLAGTGLRVIWPQARDHLPQMVSPVISQALLDIAESTAAYPASYVAKPIARPRKQQFTARNYPDTTPMRSPYVQVGRTIKRRVRVNRALAVWYANEQPLVRSVGVDEADPATAQLLITTGMLCECRRAGYRIVGLVSAVHSSGRLTLSVPHMAGPDRVRWQRIIVSPRLHLRVLSNDPVVFLPISPPNDNQDMPNEPG